MILGSVYKTEVEEDGSIPILDTLKSFARLSTEVVLVGQGDFLEIWSPEIWSKQEEQLLDVEKDPNRFSMLTLSTR
jgi:MraZ protein